MNQTFIGCSLYHTYVSILLAYDARKKGNKSLLILINDRVKDIETLIPNLKQLGVFDDIISIKSYSLFKDLKKNIGLGNYLFNRQESLRVLFERENPVLAGKEAFIKDSQINIFHVVRTRAYFLIKYPENYFRMMEEGDTTYEQVMPLTRYLKRKYFIKFPILMGHDKQVKEVCVQYPEKMKDPVLRKKAVKLEFQKLQDDLDASEKNAILECFLSKKPDFSGSRKLLLITQPLSQDNLATEAQKISIYRQIVEKAQQKGYTVYIKTHPRELTDYGQVFPTAELIPRLFPIEIFNLTDSFSFEIGITVFSGSLQNLRNINRKITLGREILDNPDAFVLADF